MLEVITLIKVIHSISKSATVIFLYGLLCMAASGWIDIIHYTYIHTYKHTYKDDATIYTMQ